MKTLHEFYSQNNVVVPEWWNEPIHREVSFRISQGRRLEAVKMIYDVGVRQKDSIGLKNAKAIMDFIEDKQQKEVFVQPTMELEKFNYYASELDKISPEDNVSIKLRDNNDDTKWLALNDESANELMKWLIKNYHVNLQIHNLS